MERVATIAVNTYRESVRSKILYSLVIFAIAVVLLASLYGTVSIGDQVKVIKDFGLFSLSLFTVAYAVISGSVLLNKELTKKTVYNILAKPVYRWEFIFGKYLGMLLTVGLMILLMSVGLLGYAYLFEGKIDLLLFQAAYYVFLELVILCATAIFFSAIVVTPLLTGMFTFGIFIVGRSLDYLLYFVSSGQISGAAGTLLEFLNIFLPNLNKLNVVNSVVYGYSISFDHFLWSTLYALGYAGVLLFIANLIFQRRDFN